MNVVVEVGRLTKDVEIKRLDSGSAVVKFTIAVDRPVPAGQEKQADFIGCVAWNAIAENMYQHLHKGSQIAVIGRIQTRKYDNNGVTVYVTEVVVKNVQFLDPKPKANDYQPEGVGQTEIVAPAEYVEVPYDDGLPFI